MDAKTYTGSDEEVDALVDAIGDEADRQWRDNATFLVLDSAPFRAWRDAAVARFLAEAGAVHPKVRTPNRIQQWLKQHDWWIEPSPDPKRRVVEWANAAVRQYVYVPGNPGHPDYAERADEVLCVAAVAADMTLSQVLAEVAALPDEVAW